MATVVTRPLGTGVHRSACRAPTGACVRAAGGPLAPAAAQGRLLARAMGAIVAVASFAVIAIAPAAAQRQPSASADAGPSPRATLAAARTWGYLLQNVTYDRLARTSYDVLVVDAGTPSPGAQLSRRDLARLKRKPDGTRRIVLAYVNIGEAEDYRDYWRKAWAKAPPPWMGSANCRWKGDHRVRHWHPAWQAIVYGSPRSLIGRIVDAGFDGAWLDRVDIYTHWRKERPEAFSEMVELVVALSAWAKARKPGFLIVPQNGEALLADPRYLAAIDGQGKEDMLYGDRGNDVPNSEARIARAAGFLAKAREAGLPVLAVEYMRKADNRVLAKPRLRALDFVPNFAPRSLSRFETDGPAHPEDGDSEPVLEDGDSVEAGCR